MSKAPEDSEGQIARFILLIVMAGLKAQRGRFEKRLDELPRSSKEAIVTAVSKVSVPDSNSGLQILRICGNSAASPVLADVSPKLQRNVDANLREKAIKLEDELSKMAFERDSSEWLVNDLKQKLAQADEKARDLQDEAAHFKMLSDHLEHENVQLRDQHSTIFVQLGDVERELEHSVAEVAVLETEKTKLNQAVSARDGVIISLRQQLVVAKIAKPETPKASPVKEPAAQPPRENADLKQKIVELQVAVSHLEHELNARQDTVEMLENKISDLLDSNSRNRLDASSEAHSDELSWKSPDMPLNRVSVLEQENQRIRKELDQVIVAKDSLSLELEEEVMEKKALKQELERVANQPQQTKNDNYQKEEIRMIMNAWYKLGMRMHREGIFKEFNSN